MQHQAHHCILCSQHVHLDRHRCAEVIAGNEQLQAAHEDLSAFDLGKTLTLTWTC
ncbi:MAG: hypothetical protein KAT11_01435 [Phycisphaerae bacterium]|nr:hypothetical protein [Phycisphaerae bacterium]